MAIINNRSAAVKMLALAHFAGVRPRLMEALLHYFGNLDRILNADAGSLMSTSGMSTDAANAITTASQYLDRAEAYQKELRQSDIEVISRFDDPYPRRLFELNDPPSLLYVRGMLFSQEDRLVGIAGADDATNEGIELTVHLARTLAEAGIKVISSLKKGIDAATHVGSKAAAGISYAVLSGGHNHIHPEESVPIAVDIVKAGGLISEYPPDREYAKVNYKESNRLLAAMSQAMVITELYTHSEATIDLLHCCSQIGKLAFVLIDPRHGALTDTEAMNKAISYGALPMVGLDKIDDIIRSLV